MLLEGNKTSEDLKIVKPLTKAQYNALSPTEQMNGTIYLITDDNGGGYVAPGNIIDNLVSTDAQSALSANQGRVLDGKIGAMSSTIANHTAQISQLNAADTTLNNSIAQLTTKVQVLNDTVTTITDPYDPTGLNARLTILEQGGGPFQKLIQAIKDMFIYDSTGKILTIDPTKLDNITW